MDAPASLIIDPMNILGEEGGRFKICGGFFEPPERKSGWRATRKKRCVTCRPLRSLKDSVLRLRSCLALAQNIKYYPWTMQSNGFIFIFLLAHSGSKMMGEIRRAKRTPASRLERLDSSPSAACVIF